MTDNEAKPEKPEPPMDGRLDPKRPFLLLLATINDDNTINPQESVLDAMHDMKSAEQIALDHAEDSDEEVWVYECRPVLRVFRPPVRMQKLGKR